MGWLDDFGDWLEDIGDAFVGSDAEQIGDAQTTGQKWLENKLMPFLGQGINRGIAGQPLYQTPQAPQAPGVPDYNVTPYQTPQAPYASPQDMIQSGEMNTAQNLMQQFYSGGGGGSAMGGLSGQGQGVMGNVLTNLAQGAVGRYAQMQLPYAQMQGQQAQDVWNQQNQVWGQGLNQQNLGYTMGQIPQWQSQTQATAAPWSFANMFPGVTGSPMIQPGQQGMGQAFMNMMPYMFFG